MDQIGSRRDEADSGNTIQRLYDAWVGITMDSISAAKPNDEAKPRPTKSPDEVKLLKFRRAVLEAQIVAVGYPVLGLGPSPSFDRLQPDGGDELFTSPISLDDITKAGFRDYRTVTKGTQTYYALTLQNVFNMILSKLIEQGLIRI